MTLIPNKPLKGNARKELIEGLYRLSGLQQGMLFHGLYDKAAGAYIKQFACDLIGVDLEAFKKSWNYVLNRHTILRSAFIYDAFTLPVQCVYKDVELPLKVVDYREMSPNAQAAAIKEYEQADLGEPFDFKAPPTDQVSAYPCK